MLNWHIRAFNQADIPALAALFDTADRTDHLYKLSSEEDIRESFSDIPPATASATTRVIVATDPSRPGIPHPTLLGMGRISTRFHNATRERVYHVMLRAHPSSRPHGLQDTIARQLIDTVREHESDPATPPAEKVRLLTYVFDSQVSAIEAWGKLGLRNARTGWTMARTLSEPIKAEPTPEGITLRTYLHPDDNPQALHTFNSALADYYDFHPVSQASWDREMAAPYSRPDLSWLAFSESAPHGPVGLAGCQVNDSENKQAGRLEGWIEGIGVIPTFRHRGVGKALLSRCLQAFREDGLNFALADVDSQSLPAVRLFQHAGFTVRCALLQYECALSDIQL
jgi:ribosomal protein S18 acetylase RimI-like enzyme